MKNTESGEHEITVYVRLDGIVEKTQKKTMEIGLGLRSVSFFSPCSCSKPAVINIVDVSQSGLPSNSLQN